MIYFQTKRDLTFLQNFKNDVIDYIDLVNDYPTKGYPATDGRYVLIQGGAGKRKEPILRKDQLREKIAKKLIEVIKLSEKVSALLPHFGHPYATILEYAPEDSKSGRPISQRIIDTIDQTIGEYERLLQIEKSPLYWLQQLVIGVLRSPKGFLRLAGFTEAAIEKYYSGYCIAAFVGFILYPTLSAIFSVLSAFLSGFSK